MALALLFGAHGHQPVGNFPSVLETAHERCYRPFLRTLHRFPGFRFSLHFSGCLLDYLLARHPDDMALLNEMVDRGGGPAGTHAEGHGNFEFIVALFHHLLPGGGKIVFDESRHDADAYSAAIYDSLETVTVITSDPLMVGLVFAGTGMILAMVILKAKDKENWIHRFDINTINRRRELPDQRRVIQDRLRWAVLRKVRMINSMSDQELQELPPPQIAERIPDPQMRELYLNQGREWSPDELRQLTGKLKQWQR